MKTKLVFVSLFLSVASYMFAQESEAPGYRTPFKAGGLGDNWFIQLGAGGQLLVTDDDSDDPSFTDRITLAPTLSVGKWLNPFYGIRFKGEGGSLHGFYDDGKFMVHDKYFNVHFDFMWNMASYYGKYRPNRFFGFIPYMGVGYLHRNENDQIAGAPKTNGGFGQAYDGLSFNGGIMMTFRLGSHVDFFTDFGAIVAGDEFNRVVHASNYEFVPSATAGFTFKLGKSTFEPVTPMDPDLINRLQKKNAELQADNDRMAKQLPCPKCPEQKAAPAPVVEKDIVGAPTLVTFRLGSATVDANQQVNVYNVAQYMKNSGEKVKVIGYADKKTGSSALNMKLSEQRAKAVAKELVSKYNIPSQNIVIEWKGASEQPFGENNWNRVVIMRVQE